MRKRALHIELSIGIAMAVSILACSSRPLGASDAALAHARSRAANGALVYQSECASCHGERGEGLAGIPPVMGDEALPLYPKHADMAHQYASGEQARLESERMIPSSAARGAFKTAGDLEDFVSTHMPRMRKTPVPLTQEQYWAVVSYLVAANGDAMPPSGIDASNANTVFLHP
jgi:mono/diheme cytochrome c family protein